MEEIEEFKHFEPQLTEVEKELLKFKDWEFENDEEVPDLFQKEGYGLVEKNKSDYIMEDKTIDSLVDEFLKKPAFVNNLKVLEANALLDKAQHLAYVADAALEVIADRQYDINVKTHEFRALLHEYKKLQEQCKGALFALQRVSTERATLEKLLLKAPGNPGNNETTHVARAKGSITMTTTTDFVPLSDGHIITESVWNKWYSTMRNNADISASSAMDAKMYEKMSLHFISYMVSSKKLVPDHNKKGLDDFTFDEYHNYLRLSIVKGAQDNQNSSALVLAEEFRVIISNPMNQQKALADFNNSAVERLMLLKDKVHYERVTGTYAGPLDHTVYESSVVENLFKALPRAPEPKKRLASDPMETELAKDFRSQLNEKMIPYKKTCKTVDDFQLTLVPIFQSIQQEFAASGILLQRTLKGSDTQSEVPHQHTNKGNNKKNPWHKQQTQQEPAAKKPRTDRNDQLECNHCGAVGHGPTQCKLMGDATFPHRHPNVNPGDGPWASSTWGKRLAALADREGRPYKKCPIHMYLPNENATKLIPLEDHQKHPDFTTKSGSKEHVHHTKGRGRK